MKIKNILTLLGILISLHSIGQEYAFKVLVNKGKNEIKVGNDWQPIKTGHSLGSGDELKISENSYIGLIHATGKPLEVKEAGKYKVVDLAARVSGGSSVLNKYTDFILSSNSQKKNDLLATGAVHRGTENIKVFLPKSEFSVVYGNTVVINWEYDKALAPYIITFKSMFGDELKKIESTEDNVTIDLSEPTFVNEDNILIDVHPKTDRTKASGDYTLKRISPADKDRIKNAISEIEAQTSEQTALNKLVLAGFYEKNGLLVNAITAYQEAIKLAPDVSEYKEQYHEFLRRNDIKEK